MTMASTPILQFADTTETPLPTWPEEPGPALPLFLLSVTHNTAPLALRERLALDADAQARLLSDLSHMAADLAAIVTCNRREAAPGRSFDHDCGAAQWPSCMTKRVSLPST